MVRNVQKLIEEIQETEEEIPKIALICPIHKNNDKKQCNNYRKITLVNVT